MIGRLAARNEWKFFGVLPKADRRLAILWWGVLVLRGVLPAGFAVAMGGLVGAVQRGDDLRSAAQLRWRGVRPVPGPHTGSSGDQRQSW